MPAEMLDGAIIVFAQAEIRIRRCSSGVIMLLQDTEHGESMSIDVAVSNVGRVIRALQEIAETGTQSERCSG